MKKIVCYIFSCVIFSASVHAQIANTKWSGTMKIPQGGGSVASAPVEWDFAKDTLTVEVAGGGPEVFTFKDVKNVITMSKISGSSQCPAGAIVTMTYAIKNDQLIFIKQASDCDTYKQVASEDPLKKMK